MPSQLPDSTFQALLPLLGSIARLVVRNLIPEDRQLRTLVDGVELAPDDNILAELRRWTALLVTVQQHPTESQAAATLEALLLREIPESSALLAVRTVMSRPPSPAADPLPITPTLQPVRVNRTQMDLGRLLPGARGTAELEVQGGPGQVIATSEQIRFSPDHFGPDPTRIQVEVLPLSAGVLWASIQLVTTSETLEVPVLAQWADPAPSVAPNPPPPSPGIEFPAPAPAASGLEARIRVLIRPGIAWEHAIAPHENPFLIGRRNEAQGILPHLDLSFHDPEMLISQRHAQIIRDGTKYVIEDLGSRNGTMLKNWRIPVGQLAGLQHGDVIRMGKIQIEFLLGSGGSRA